MRKKGLYWEIDHPPQAILDVINRFERRALPWRRAAGWISEATIKVALVAVVVSLTIAPLGSCLRDRSLGEFGVFLGITQVAATATIFVGFVIVFALRRVSYCLEWQLSAAYRILHTLRDDARWITGWLDLTGPKQRTKWLRRTRSRGGKYKHYYRDPWFRVKARLWDGNLLSLSLTDKVKAEGKSKRGGGTTVAQRTQLAAKLVVDPGLYRVDGAFLSSLSGITTTISPPEGVLTFSTEVNLYGQTQGLGWALDLVRSLYEGLVPVGQAQAVGG